MKRIFICALIVIALIIIGAASFYCTETVTESSSRKVEDISRSFENGEFENARSLSMELCRRWEDYAGNDIFIVDKDHVSEITLSLLRLKALAEEEDPGITAECRVAVDLLRLYREKTGIALKNIF